MIIGISKTVAAVGIFVKPYPYLKLTILGL